MTVIPTDQTTADPAVQTAEIIPFPVRAPALPVVSTPQERLVRALGLLNAAMIEQRAAMAEWRRALAQLKTSTAGVGDSLACYRSSLRSLGHGVDSLQKQATVLARWADQSSPIQGSPSTAPIPG